MILVTLARKPMSERNVATNCLKWGAGALNIDGTRISGSVPVCTGQGFRTGKYGGQIGHGETTLDGEVWTPASGGRWPANLILMHKPSCVRAGSKKVVSGSATSKTFHDAYGDASQSHTGFLRGWSHPGNQHADPDGNETVEAWECADGCPVDALDAEVGTLSSGVMKAGQKRKASKGKGGYHDGFPDEASYNGTYGDKGGPSRFFKQVSGGWVCAEGCPVASLDDEVGDLASRGNRGGSLATKSSPVLYGPAQRFSGAEYNYADEGGPSRFFKQEPNLTELVEYLRTMISTPVAEAIVVPGLAAADGYTEQVGIIVQGEPTEEQAQALMGALVPGGHLMLIAPEGSIGYRGACAIEDAGFEIRDTIMVVTEPGEVHYVAKAAKSERNAGLDDPNKHPTVKPKKIMQRVLEGVAGPVLEPFMGSGTTLVAALETGHSITGIEREEEFLALADARVRHNLGLKDVLLLSDYEKQSVSDPDKEEVSLMDFLGLEG